MICHLIGFHVCTLQALKSGQLPADLKSLTDDIMLDKVDEKHEDVVHAESNDTQEPKNTDGTQMEQVYFLLFLVFQAFLVDL